MADEILKRDQNRVVVLGGVTDDANQEVTMLRVDPTTKRLLVSATGGAGSGTVTSVSVVSANGFAGTVATATTTPAITLTTSITGILKGNGTAISAVTIGSGLSYDGTTLSATGGGITVGTTTITSGTNTRILYNNSGVVGEYTLTGSGTVVAMATAPTFVTSITTPAILATANDSGAIGSATSSFSDLFLASGALINFANGNAVITHSSGVLTVSTGDLRVTTAGTNTASVVTVGGSQTLTNKTLTSPVISSISNSGTITIPTGTDTLVGRATTDTLTNKTIQAGIFDYVIEPATDDTYSGESSNDINAGDTIAQWSAVYLDSTSSRWELTDADSVTTAGGVLIALATAAGTDGNPMNVIFRGVVRNDGWTWSGAGKPLYLSTTPGALTETAPSGTDDVIRVVGYTLSDDAIYFNPSNDWITYV